MGAGDPYAPQTFTDDALFPPGDRIGRVTEGLLLPIADEVDIIEPVAKLTLALSDKPGIRSIANVGLADWQPGSEASYDLIWHQWCLGYLTDSQLVDHLQLCKSVLKHGDGLIIVKENLSTSGKDLLDEEDGCTTRQVHPAWVVRHLMSANSLKKQGGCQIPRPFQRGRSPACQDGNSEWNRPAGFKKAVSDQDVCSETGPVSVRKGPGKVWKLSVPANYPRDDII